MAISKIGSDGLNQAGDTILCADSGNVGIGTSTITTGVSGTETTLALQGNSSGKAASFVAVNAAGSGSGLLGVGTDNNTYVFAKSNSALIFGTNNTERARIDSSGNFMVGTTIENPVSNNVIGFSARGQYGETQICTDGAVSGAPLYLNRKTTDGSIVEFRKDGSTVGTITVTASSTAYNTSSDYRLKEDWVAVADASTRVNALKPVNFAWKVDGARVDGFLAHELAEVVPEAVTGEKDAVELVDIKDEDGNVTGQEERPVYQGIDQSKLVPLLTAALQEALAKIDDLTARVSALEAS